jgi:aspartate racemase
MIANGEGTHMSALDHPDWKRVIGIMGGLGPYAHLEFEQLILAATAKMLGRPAYDQDYPPWILSSEPATPERTAALLSGGESALPALEKSARRLLGENGADFAAIPCNTAHAYLDELRSRVPLPFLDMIQETVQEALQRVGPSGGVGILATTGTLKTGIYANRLEALGKGARALSPLDLANGEELQENLVMEPIFGPLVDGERAGGGIKSGKFRDPVEKERLARPLRKAAKLLAEAGAEIVLTACTEIPLAVGRESADGVPLLDPMDVAARACVDIAMGKRPLPE